MNRETCPNTFDIDDRCSENVEDCKRQCESSTNCKGITVSDTYKNGCTIYRCMLYFGDQHVVITSLRDDHVCYSYNGIQIYTTGTGTHSFFKIHCRPQCIQ